MSLTHPEETSDPAERFHDELAAAAAGSLQGSGYAALSFVGCQSQGDRIILNGTVPNFHLKQLAQAFVQRVAGVRCVDNRLAVRWPGESLRAPS